MPWSINGKIRDHDGNGASGVRVVAVNRPALPENLVVIESTVSGAGGEYTVSVADEYAEVSIIYFSPDGADFIQNDKIHRVKNGI